MSAVAHSRSKKMPREQVEITLFYIHQTDKALCVAETDDEGDPEIWLPKRWKGEDLAWQQKGTKITVWAPEDLLLDKGLI
jgi:hypothetical protein